MMGMATVTQRVPTVEVLVHGELDAWSAPHINDVIEQAMLLSPLEVIIDLAECTSIDAAGIILLLDVHRRAIRTGGSVALRAPSARLCRNLRLARVDRVLRVINPQAVL
jgi:anti-sigma B factor antagonist